MAPRPRRRKAEVVAEVPAAVREEARRRHRQAPWENYRMVIRTCRDSGHPRQLPILNRRRDAVVVHAEAAGPGVVVEHRVEHPRQQAAVEKTARLRPDLLRDR